MNHTTDQKISNLIEESIGKQFLSLLQKIGVLPKKILDKIKQKYKVKPLEEAQTGAPKIEGTTNSRDTCYTAVMKLIGEENIINKHETLHDFIVAYHEKSPKVIKLHDVTVQKLKPGTILFYKFKYQSLSTVNRGYGKFGVKQQDEAVVGHLEIYLGVDEGKNKTSNKDDKYVTLGNEYVGDDRAVSGSALELKLDYQTAASMNRKPSANAGLDYVEVLDYNTIKKM